MKNGDDTSITSSALERFDKTEALFDSMFQTLDSALFRLGSDPTQEHLDKRHDQNVRATKFRKKLVEFHESRCQ